MSNAWADGVDVQVRFTSGPSKETDFDVLTFDNQAGDTFNIEVTHGDLVRISDLVRDALYSTD